MESKNKTVHYISPKDGFKVTSTRVCSKHSLFSDFIEYDSKKRNLNPGAIPSIFIWTSQSKRKSPKKSHDSEATDTTSESEDPKEQCFDKEVQASLLVPCSHQFSMQTILASNPKLKLVQFYTGFQKYDIFKEVLNFIVLGCDRSQIVYWEIDAHICMSVDQNILTLMKMIFWM